VVKRLDPKVDVQAHLEAMTNDRIAQRYRGDELTAWRLIRMHGIGYRGGDLQARRTDVRADSIARRSASFGSKARSTAAVTVALEFESRWTFHGRALRSRSGVVGFFAAPTKQAIWWITKRVTQLNRKI
jgi:hypothetical protein